MQARRRRPNPPLVRIAHRCAPVLSEGCDSPRHWVCAVSRPLGHSSRERCNRSSSARFACGGPETFPGWTTACPPPRSVEPAGGGVPRRAVEAWAPRLPPTLVNEGIRHVHQHHLRASPRLLGADERRLRQLRAVLVLHRRISGRRRRRRQPVPTGRRGRRAGLRGAAALRQPHAGDEDHRP